MDATPEIVVTGIDWLGGGVGAIESVLHRLFGEARSEIAITTYAISTGADPILLLIEHALGKGILVKMVVNRIAEQPAEVVSRLLALARSFEHFELYDFDGGMSGDLHAKSIVCDRRAALIGSSNLSRRGLVANHEMGCLIRGQPAAVAAGLIDRLLASKHSRRVRPSPSA